MIRLSEFIWQTTSIVSSNIVVILSAKKEFIGLPSKKHFVIIIVKCDNFFKLFYGDKRIWTAIACSGDKNPAIERYPRYIYILKPLKRFELLAYCLQGSRSSRWATGAMWLKICPPEFESGLFWSTARRNNHYTKGRWWLENGVGKIWTLIILAPKASTISQVRWQPQNSQLSYGLAEDYIAGSFRSNVFPNICPS